MKFSDMAGLLQVKPLLQHSDPVIESLLTDSRKLLLPAGTVFFAISSARHNATRYIPGLFESGVRCFVVGKEFSEADANALPGANILQVDNVVDALQLVAAAHRHKFSYPVIGITGSNGKTIVKEWLYQLLQHEHNIVRSPKSYNSQVGVPLSVWEMTGANTLGIFEAGISLPGEMQRLQKIIDPQIGVFTFVGDAHAEGFSSLKQKIEEKLQLFSNSKTLVYCADDSLLQETVTAFRKNVNSGLSVFGWSRNPGMVVHISRIEKQESGSVISCSYKDEEHDFFIPFTDDASIHNAITCCCVLMYMGAPFAGIAAHICQLKPVEMRLELKEGINNCSIINDSYSTDLNSLGIALDFLMQQHQHRKRTVILSDIPQSSLKQDDLYKKVAEILKGKGLHRFIGIGPQLTEHAGLFEGIADPVFFPGTDEFLEHHTAFRFQDEAILLKGARVFRFEQISHALEQKLHETVLEINLNALRDNLNRYRQLLPGHVKMMAMVKAFSYGSGTFEIAGLLQHAAVDYLAVAYADEGVTLRRAGIRLPIMVMNTGEPGFSNIIQYRLEPEIYSFRILSAFDSFLEQHGLDSYPVHIKLDTGMHRLGFTEEDIDRLCSILAHSHRMKVVSVFSHLVASDEPLHDSFTMQQAASFSVMAAKLEQAVGHPFIKHISNTAAIHRHAQLQFDMVRLGIGLYGVDANLKLHNVTTLKTTISQIKLVHKGESVGYSRKAVMDKESVIAVVRIGYADGYPRLLGNGNGKMLLKGHMVPVVGNVCMDMTMLDITGIEAAEGDDVIVFGEGLPVTDVAKWAQTIPYEILTNISQRVKRVYYEE